MSWCHGSGGIEYGLDDARFESCGGGGDLLILQNVHPASYMIDTGVAFPGIIVDGAWGWAVISIQCWGSDWVDLHPTPCFRGLLMETIAWTVF